MSPSISPNPLEVLKVFQKMAAEDTWLRKLCPAGPAFSRRRIYTLGVVLQLMILQRLMAKFTLSSAVQYLAERWPETTGAGQRGISLGVAAYCRARQKVPTLVARQVLEQMIERLQGWFPSHAVLPDRTVYVCDGSTLALPYSAELSRHYPPHRNQKAASHWPLLRIVVLQEAQTGLAVCPQWGPETVSEQELALRAIAALPAGAVLVGDRNFGVFGVASAASRHGHDVIVRLTKVRAERLAGGPLQPGCDKPVTWTPTRWDSCGGPYAAQAAVTGRLLCLAASDPKQTELVFLFTTLALPADKIAALYALRWNVETDLRSLKQTVRLRELSARSVDLLDKELLLAFAAYNLVRAVICLAAEKAQVPPRRISFTNVYTLLRTFALPLHAHRHAAASDPFWDFIIDMAAQYKLPNRSKSRSFPRAVWSKPQSFPAKHALP